MLSNQWMLDWGIAWNEYECRKVVDGLVDAGVVERHDAFHHKTRISHRGDTAGAHQWIVRSAPGLQEPAHQQPRPAGKTNRHRLNRGGDRQANSALYRIVVVRLRHDCRTKAYMLRRIGEGMSKTEVIRCLKRYVAREVFAALQGSAKVVRSAA